MKKSVLIGLILAATTAGTSANELSKQNLVERSLTLKDSELVFSGGLFHGETGDENDTGLALNAGYGLTDNLTVGLGGARYRFIERANDGQGLEMAFSLGAKGHMEQNNEDVHGYGADVIGKYVFSSDFALLFAAEYVYWNHKGTDDASENRYTLGAQYQVVDNLTWSVDYTYRDLKDFNQDHAYSASTGLQYGLSKNTDVGVMFAYSDFDTEKNGYDTDSAYKRNVGAYVNYRF